jgi:hypothetical protein
MRQAQRRQADGRAVEPISRFGRCLIHTGMPLCFGSRDSSSRPLRGEMIYYNNIAIKAI